MNESNLAAAELEQCWREQAPFVLAAIKHDLSRLQKLGVNPLVLVHGAHCAVDEWVAEALPRQRLARRRSVRLVPVVEPPR